MDSSRAAFQMQSILCQPASQPASQSTSQPASQPASLLASQPASQDCNIRIAMQNITKRPAIRQQRPPRDLVNKTGRLKSLRYSTSGSILKVDFHGISRAVPAPPHGWNSRPLPQDHLRRVLIDPAGINRCDPARTYSIIDGADRWLIFTAAMVNELLVGLTIDVMTVDHDPAQDRQLCYVRVNWPSLNQ